MPGRSSGRTNVLGMQGLPVNEFPGLMHNTIEPFELKLKNKDGNYRLWINEEEIIDFDHVESIGNLMSVKFGFLGSGSADKLRIYDSSGQVAYKDDFDTD